MLTKFDIDQNNARDEISCDNNRDEKIKKEFKHNSSSQKFRDN